MSKRDTDALSHLDRDGIDGDDPMKPVGPEDCAPKPDDCEFEAGERDGPPHETLYDSSAEIDEAFPVEELHTPLAADGLPDHSADVVGAGTHPFTRDTMCCIGDDRVFVELFVEELLGRDGWEVEDERPRLGSALARVGGKQVTLGVRSGARERVLQMDVRHCYDDDGHERERRSFEPGVVQRRWGHAFVVPTDPKHGWIPVRPIRERCRYYARQHFANDDASLPTDQGHHIFYRLCLHPARRSIGGAAMSLRDEAVYGCDIRDPHDPHCVAFINDHDETKLRTRPDRTLVPMFGMAGEEIHLDDDEQTEDESHSP